MLVINREETVAVAFCPENSFLLKKGQAIVFPGRYVKRNDKWEPDPVEPGPDLVPVPDCVRKYITSVSEMRGAGLLGFRNIFRSKGDLFPQL